MGRYLRFQKFWNNMKNVNRQVVLALLDKIKEIGDKRYIPVLKTWQKGEVRKVRQKIEGVITRFENEGGGKD